MTDVQVEDAAAGTDGRSRRRWWRWPIAVGTVLLLVPVAAALLTNRDPDPVYTHSCWSPIASTPTDALQPGSVGLDILVATGIAAAVARVISSRRRSPRHLAAVLAVVLALAGAAGWIVAAHANADASAATIRTVLGHPSSGARTITSQARAAIGLAVGLSGPSGNAVRVLHESSAPVGPWIVQTTEVLNENLDGEGADATVETLVDPVTGSIEAAWSSGF